MKVVLQRVLEAKVEVDEKVVGKCGNGLLLLVGFTHSDNQERIDKMVKKVTNLRIFSDGNDKMNLSILETKGEILCVSQFTLYADSEKGNRPSFMDAAKPEIAIELFDNFVKILRDYTDLKVETGIFGAKMKVSLANDGPVTIILEN